MSIGAVLSSSLDGSKPVLSSPSVQIDGADFTAYVTTTVQTGYGYMVVVPNGSGQPSASQIKAGQQSSGASAVVSSTRRVHATDPSSLIIYDEHLTVAENTTYDVYFIQTNEINIDSNIVTTNVSSITFWPLLSAATVASKAATTCTPRVTTNWADGVLYYVIVAGGTATGLTVDQVKADSPGEIWSGYANTVSSAGVFTFAQVTGLTASTSYDIAYAHVRERGATPTSPYDLATIYNFTTDAP